MFPFGEQQQQRLGELIARSLFADVKYLILTSKHTVYIYTMCN